jgi:hypothetical protein
MTFLRRKKPPFLLFYMEFILFQEINRPRGGQPGNQNARKHGYYSNVLNGLDRVDLKEASSIIGLDDEIALVRSRLKSVVKNSPDNVHLISHLASTLAKLMRTNEKLRSFEIDDLEKKRLKVLFDSGSSFGWSTADIIAAFLGKSAPSK